MKERKHKEKKSMRDSWPPIATNVCPTEIDDTQDGETHANKRAVGWNSEGNRQLGLRNSAARHCSANVARRHQSRKQTRAVSPTRSPRPAPDREREAASRQYVSSVPPPRSRVSRAPPPCADKPDTQEGVHASNPSPIDARKTHLEEGADDLMWGRTCTALVSMARWREEEPVRKRKKEARTEESERVKKIVTDRHQLDAEDGGCVCEAMSTVVEETTTTRNKRQSQVNQRRSESTAP
ncbi:hypothetical protein C8R45DRAFT_946249 [Mycena sanguinolenta]|nr:hypothetical protein C8R45DRAFT_946249 [Mycena sanguinolenta]